MVSNHVVRRDVLTFSYRSEVGVERRLAGPAESGSAGPCSPMLVD